MIYVMFRSFDIRKIGILVYNYYKLGTYISFCDVLLYAVYMLYLACYLCSIEFIYMFDTLSRYAL